MKPFMTLLLIGLLTLVGCGGDEVQTATQADTQETPGEVVEAFANAMQAGDAEKLQSLCPDFADNLTASEIATFAAQAAKNAQANGGIASIKIDSEVIKDNTATVTATLTNGKGLEQLASFLALVAQASCL